MNDWHITSRVLANGRRAEVVPLTFGRGRICLVNQHCDSSYDDMW
jgi:hypothetical protein